VKNITVELSLDLNHFSFSNCNTNPNQTHLPKHQTLNPNHQFSQRIWYVECYSVHAHTAWNQKFRLTPVIPPPTLLQNVLFSLLLLTSVVQKVRVCTVDFVSASKNTLLLYVAVCEKIVARLNKRDDVIEENFMKISAPAMKSWLRPWFALKAKIEKPSWNPTWESSSGGSRPVLWVNKNGQNDCFLKHLWPKN